MNREIPARFCEGLWVKFPRSTLCTTEGTVVKWLKREGDPVSEGEALVEIEFAKATQELPSPVTGVLTKILLAEGQTAEVYTEIALIEAR